MSTPKAKQKPISKKMNKITTKIAGTASQYNKQYGFFNSLEDHVFHDTSYRTVTSFEGASNLEYDYHQNNESFHYLYKLDGSSLGNYSDVSDSENSLNSDSDIGFVNHYKRGLFRQKRRDWYLNRRKSTLVLERKSFIYYYFLLLKVIMLSVIRKTSKSVSRLILKRWNGFIYLQRKYISTTFVHYSLSNGIYSMKAIWNVINWFCFWLLRIISNKTNLLYFAPIQSGWIYLLEGIRNAFWKFLFFLQSIYTWGKSR